jgi:putative drug exporter of the RND superfamily
LSVGAALGALVLVFQEGHGSSLFGIDGGTGAVFSLVPIVTFALVFGLSIDVVFSGFAFGNVLVVKMLGFALAVAVIIDATLVRMVIEPALLRVCGAWNWWPWGLGRL